MPPPEYIVPLHTRSRIDTIGRKAANLRFLREKGFRTPAAHACIWDAYSAYTRGEERILDALRQELEAKLDAGTRYAVRSSANLEDQLDASFAGQFRSVLDVEGVDGILEAIQSIWGTTRSPAIEAYLVQMGQTAADLKMAIMIQEMVPPVVSGVAFSRNPVTGLDEVVVEAVRGSGEALVQEGVTPGRWVNKWGTWTHTPDGAREAAEIDLKMIADVVRETKAIAQAYGRPVDLEWVHDGAAVQWVQLREITSLDVPIYTNRISKEVFPGIIKPLVWSVNVPLVNGAWVALLTEMIGPNDLRPESLAASFYSRAYFNMSALGQIFELLGLPRETLELLMGIEVEGPERPSFKPSSRTYRLVPRLIRFALGKARFARQVEAFLPVMEERFRSFQGTALSELTEAQILEEIDRLYPLAQEAAYYNIVTPLLMQVYNQMVKGQLRRVGVDFERLDLTGDMQGLEAFDPNSHLSALHREYARLDKEVKARIEAGGYEELAALPGTGSLRAGTDAFLERFGHLSDSGNDFSHRPWRESPDLVLQMIAKHTPIEPAAADSVRFQDLPLPTLRRPLFTALYHRARRFRLYREAVSSLYTFGYGLFRDRFLAVAEQLVQRGILSERDDIFYLTLGEVREIVHAGDGAQDWRATVRERMAEIERARDLIPPEIIYGDQAPPLDPHSGQGFKGTPTSRGHYTGPARVARGIQDMDKVQDGDVLVVPYSDVGWTPLFTRAGAVVAESGGILSHSSIIAREYGIPAVVSVRGACQIADGTLVTVDGYRGEIVIHERDETIPGHQSPGDSEQVEN